ncbi:MAG: methionyl-tRNA formyltransferase [Nitrospirota bacterium]
MSLVFFGSPEFAVPSLKSLAEAGEEVVAVVTRPDRRRSRGGGPEPSRVKEKALDMGIRVLEPVSMKDQGFLGELRSLRPEFIVVVAYGRRLTPGVLDAPSIAPVNLHGSLLPRYRGAAPIAWAVINGEKETGLTTMVITERLDEGPILLQKAIPIAEEDTAGSLSRRMAEAGGPLLVDTLRGLREGSITPRPQEGPATYAPPFKKEDGRINWKKSALEIHDLVRGMQPWPGAFGDLDGLRVKILRVSVFQGEGEPGVVKDVSDGYIFVGTGDGIISIDELQAGGKRAMASREFLRGRTVERGMVMR